ncbi:CHAT domain-containing protein [Suillus ampliporus]|nr:CHAT domain-containing protein [Suillus ampliporus]
MPGSLEGQYIRLEVINGKNIQVPSFRIPAGIFVFIKLDSIRRWKSTTQVLSSDHAVAWGDTLTILPDASPKLSLEIRVSFELGRMLGHGKVIGKVKTSWKELLDHGDEPFDLSFPSIDGICPSLTLKAAPAHAHGHNDGALLNSIAECEIARRTDAGHTRFSKYTRNKSGVSHLKGAVNYFQWVVAQCPVDHPDRAAALTNLAWARLRGYIRKDLQDIDSTTSLFHDALALRPQSHPDHPLALYYLTEALNWRYNDRGTTADIRKCAQLYHELLPLCAEGTYLRSIAVGENGVDCMIRKCNNLPTDASDEDIHLRRIVLEFCPLGHQYRPRALSELAWALGMHFNQHGGIDDLDESMQLDREAISLCLEGHSDRARYLNDLAFLLTSRFNHQGKSHDLDEAISLIEEALRMRPVGHKFRHISLDSLGQALFTRFDQYSDINDVNRAISLYREALTLNPPGHPSRDGKLHNFALALKVRYDKLYATEDLDEAIDMFRESLRLQQLDNPERHRTLYSLSAALCSRFMQTEQNEDFDEAIDLCQDSLAALAPLHPDRCFNYMRLQEAYLSRYRMQYNPTDLAPAVENFRFGSKHPTQGFPFRIKTALRWVEEAEDYQHESTLEAYQLCLELFDKHVMTRSSITSRRNAATAFCGAQSLAVDGASCAIRHNDPKRAVELEEQGRGQQWSLAARLRTPLEDLESASLPLAHKLEELSKRLSDAQASAGSAEGAAADWAAVEYRRVTEQWEAGVAEIRDLQGFSRFLLPPSYKELQAAALHGPVIILIASKYSCHALIVPTSGQPYHVPFSPLALADLEMLKNDFAKAIRQASRMGPQEPRTALIVLLRKIWDVIILPIVKVLQHDLKLPCRSRIWLCPTAAFTTIPLHAAHPFRPKADGHGRELCLEDLYICSYTPTLSALIRSRQLMKHHASPSFVAIGQSQPGAGQGEELLAIDSELELPRERVHSKLCNVTHGCILLVTAKQDREQPYNSHFAMKDSPLTLLDIMENNAPQAEFAFLSACHTAAGDEETPDEVIHLAAGLQFSGFKSVIGTLWVVDDDVAKHVVEAFYGEIFKDLKEGDHDMDCTKAASALNHATYAVKKIVPLEQRIVFIHIGV